MTYKRKKTIGDCTLYLGDCKEILPTLGKFDAVVTDPPYGINQANGFGGAGLAGPRSNYAGVWDNDRPRSDIFHGMINISSCQIIWGGNYFSDILPVSGRWLWWDKCQTMPTYSDGELAWTSLHGVCTKKIVYNNSGMMSREKGKVHPTQKPVEVMRWCIGFLPSAETILDPFMGSGTTGVACVKLGRKFTGIEIDENYFDIACRRIRDAYNQPDMFVEAAKSEPSVQFELLGEAAE